MNSNAICFVNSMSTEERILVSDAKSAEILRRVLSRIDHQKWVEEGEKAEEILKPEDRIVATQTPAVPKPMGKEFRVILICGDSTFRVCTYASSENGMKLKSEVPPAFQNKKVTAYITHAGVRENIEVACEVSNNGEGTSELQFLALEENCREKLSEWTRERETV